MLGGSSLRSLCHCFVASFVTSSSQSSIFHGRCSRFNGSFFLSRRILIGFLMNFGLSLGDFGVSKEVCCVCVYRDVVSFFSMYLQRNSVADMVMNGVISPVPGAKSGVIKYVIQLSIIDKILVHISLHM